MAGNLVESNTYRSWANPPATDRATETSGRGARVEEIWGFLSRSGPCTRDRENFFSWKDLRGSEDPSFASVVDLNGTRSRDFSRLVSAGHHKIFITIQPSGSNERVIVASIDKWSETNSQATAKIAQIKNEILALSCLSKGWDSYDAEPPAETAINHAMQIVGHLEFMGIVPDWCVPTSDGSILLQFQCQRVAYKWEFESDGDIGVMVKSPDEAPEYLDLPPNGVARFFAERCYEIL